MHDITFNISCLVFKTLGCHSPLACERPGKFVLPRPLWTRASENSILLSGGLGDEKGYRATRLFVSYSTET